MEVGLLCPAAVLVLAALVGMLLADPVGSSTPPGKNANNLEFSRQQNRQRYQQQQHQGLLRRRRPPEFLVAGRRFVVTRGESVTLPCRVRNLQSNVERPDTVMWKHGSVVLTVGHLIVRKDLRISVVNGTSLFVNGTDTRYAGNYSCEVDWSIAEPPASVTHYLEVQVPADVYAVTSSSAEEMGFDGKQALPVVEVEEGGNATLECRAGGIPVPTVTWTSDTGRHLFASSSTGPKLRLAAVDRADAGVYTCAAYNGVGQRVADKLALRVHHAPLVTARPRIVHVVRRTGEVRLTCDVTAVPQPNVIWHFGARELSPTNGRKMEENGSNYSLVLAGVQGEAELGNYTCEAINKMGEGRDTALLTATPQSVSIDSSPRGKYRNVYNLTWSVGSFAPVQEVSIAFKIAWSQGSWNTVAPVIFDNGDRGEEDDPLLDNKGLHIIGMTSSGSRTGGRDKNAIPSRSGRHKTRGGGGGIYSGNYVFEKLRPDTEYEVRIRAKNRFGWTESDTAFGFRTSLNDPRPQKISSFPRSRAASCSSWSESIGIAAVVASMFMYRDARKGLS